MKRAFVYTAILLFASSVWGQWDTNLWPSWETQFNGRKRAWQVYSALLERVEAVTVPTNALPQPTQPLFFGSRSDLIAYKGIVLNLMTNHYVNLSQTNEFGNFETYFLSVTDAVPDSLRAELPKFTRSNLSEILSIPTNYLDNTPWFNLNGLGVFTNDVGPVGHSHGWTNSYTVVGGTDLPEARTNWYTTDYGWVYMQDICNALIASDWDEGTNAPTYLGVDNPYGFVSLTLTGVSGIAFSVVANWAAGMAAVAQFINDESNWIATNIPHEDPFYSKVSFDRGDTTNLSCANSQPMINSYIETWSSFTPPETEVKGWINFNTLAWTEDPIDVVDGALHIEFPQQSIIFAASTIVRSTTNYSSAKFDGNYCAGGITKLRFKFYMEDRAPHDSVRVYMHTPDGDLWWYLYIDTSGQSVGEWAEYEAPLTYNNSVGTWFNGVGDTEELFDNSMKNTDWTGVYIRRDGDYRKQGFRIDDFEAVGSFTFKVYDLMNQRGYMVYSNMETESAFSMDVYAHGYIATADEDDLFANYTWTNATKQGISNNSLYLLWSEPAAQTVTRATTALPHTNQNVRPAINMDWLPSESDAPTSANDITQSQWVVERGDTGGVELETILYFNVSNGFKYVP